MERKITFKASPNETSPRTFTVDYTDMGYTKEVFENFSDEQKREAIQEYLDELIDQPYWAFDEIISE